MAKQSGLGDAALIDGYDASGDVCALTEIGGGPSLWDVTTIDKSAMARQGLQRSGRMAWNFFIQPTDPALDPDTDAIDRELKTLPYADRIASYFRAQLLGNPAASIVCKQVNYDYRREQNGALTGSVNLLSNGFSLEWGLQLTDGIDTHASAANGTGIDGGAASAFGAAAYWHVTSIATGTVGGEIQDSADNVTFAAVTGMAFSALAVPGKQRIATAQDAAIRRYVRFSSTGTFTDADLAVSFVRYEVVTPN